MDKPLSREVELARTMGARILRRADQFLQVVYRSGLMAVQAVPELQRAPQLRPASTCDTAAIARHRRLMFDEMGLASGAALERVESETRAALEHAMIEGYYHHWFAEQDGRIIAGAGVIVARWLPMPDEPALARATVLNVYTEPAFRNRGLARRLMHTVIDWCRAQGLASVQLHASDAGRPLYEALGFKATNEMRRSLR
jgi:GNAT superfamily N-acetyltransferase